jgi:type I restriction enzyme S subunit
LPWLSWIDALCRVGGGFRLRVSRSQLGEIRVPLPQYEEQVALASMIKSGTATSNILSSQASLAISLLQERRSALISAAVTGQIDVRGLAPGADAA